MCDFSEQMEKFITAWCPNGRHDPALFRRGLVALMESKGETLEGAHKEIAKLEAAMVKMQKRIRNEEDRVSELEIALADRDARIVELEEERPLLAKGELLYRKDNGEIVSIGQRHCDCCSKYSKKEPTAQEAAQEAVKVILDEHLGEL